MSNFNGVLMGTSPELSDTATPSYAASSQHSTSPLIHESTCLRLKELTIRIQMEPLNSRKKQRIDFFMTIDQSEEVPWVPLRKELPKSLHQPQSKPKPKRG
jgi:hypothetical protein